MRLHQLEPASVHRDIKPSNIIIEKNGHVNLIDFNAARHVNADKNEDTRMLGTVYFAAPEQFGYGFTASTEKTDIYAVGMLLNKMITGRFPKEERATGVIWEVIQRCIRLNPEERYSDDELINTLTDYLGETG